LQTCRSFNFIALRPIASDESAPLVSPKRVELFLKIKGSRTSSPFFNQGGAIFLDTQHVDVSFRRRKSSVSGIFSSRGQQLGEA